MKKTFIMYVKHIQHKDKKVTELLDKLSNEQREKDCGSYYKSLSGIYRHVGGCAAVFLNFLKAALSEGSEAKTVASPAVEQESKEALSEAQWKSFKTFIENVDAAFLDFVTKLTDAELNTQVKWFSGDMVSLEYALHAYIMHQAHHLGQIAQALDELKVDNDFSGIPLEFFKK
ncbi:MAG: hypothetical protein Ta2G_01470 [Termitinemataceae bacterium]|nr:MAG: hypothetical protein Ta2G_01470 [Termitinemataceae bacterium]